MLHRGHSGDGCVLASTLCKYDLRNCDLFVLGWTKVRQVNRGNISSEPLMGGDGVRIILLLPLVARCLKTIDVCIWRMFAFMSVVVNMWGSVGMFVVYPANSGERNRCVWFTFCFRFPVNGYTQWLCNKHGGKYACCIE